MRASSIFDLTAISLVEQVIAQKNWQPADEASFYADQAVWAMDHLLLEQCIAAAESAWALGRRDAVVGELRIKAYGLAAYPKWRDAEGEKAPRSGFGVAGYNYKLIDSRNQRQLVSLDTHEALQLLTQMQGLRRSLFDFQFHLQ